MKRRSDFSRKYLLYRMLPVLEVQISPAVKQIKLKMVMMNLCKPNTVWENGDLKIIQKIPIEKKGNEKGIMDALIKEANELFSGYKFKTIIRIDYE